MISVASTWLEVSGLLVEDITKQKSKTKSEIWNGTGQEGIDSEMMVKTCVNSLEKLGRGS